MSVQASGLLQITLGIVGLLLLWAISIGITYWDISRRKLSGAETVAWMLLVVLVPGIGFAAYLFSRLLGAFLSPRGPRAAPSGSRQTMYKRPPEVQKPAGTILAADLAQPTLLNEDFLGQADTTADRPQSKVKFMVVEGPYAGREIVIASLPAKIGRGPEAAVRLDDDLGVSRQHAEIYRQAGALRIRDLKSTHGTQVNGRPIDDEGLEPDDRIRVGVSTLVVGMQEDGG